MTPREVTDEQAPKPAVSFTSRSLTLYGRHNWAAVVFFAGLCILHAVIALRSAGFNRWETILSCMLAGLFGIVAVFCAAARTELTIVPLQRAIRIRRGVGRFSSHRQVSFGSVQAVRLTVGKVGGRSLIAKSQSSELQSSRIEIVCSTELIECPPTQIPRQEALYLALVFGVRLIKVYGNEWDAPAIRTDRF